MPGLNIEVEMGRWQAFNRPTPQPDVEFYAISFDQSGIIDYSSDPTWISDNILGAGFSLQSVLTGTYTHFEVEFEASHLTGTFWPNDFRWYVADRPLDPVDISSGNQFNASYLKTELIQSADMPDGSTWNHFPASSVFTSPNLATEVSVVTSAPGFTGRLILFMRPLNGPHPHNNFPPFDLQAVSESPVIVRYSM